MGGGVGRIICSVVLGNAIGTEVMAVEGRRVCVCGGDTRSRPDGDPEDVRSVW